MLETVGCVAVEKNLRNTLTTVNVPSSSGFAPVPASFRARRVCQLLLTCQRFKLHFVLTCGKR